MSTIIEGTIVGYGQQATGQGNNGPWYKQPVIIQQGGQYPKNVAVDFWNDKIQLLQQFPVGSYVRVSVNAESKQAQDGSRWFTEIRGWKIEPGMAAAAGAPTPQQYAQPQQPQQPQYAAPAQPQYQAPAPQQQQFGAPAQAPQQFAPAHQPAAPVQQQAAPQQFVPQQQAPAQAPAQFQAPAPQAQQFQPQPQQQWNNPNVNAGANPDFFKSSDDIPF